MEKSFAEKLRRVYDLAVALCYGPHDMVVNTDSIYGEETSELLWGYVDGLIQQYHHKRINGECSLAAMLAYDMTAEEATLDEHIARFEGLLRPKIAA